MTKLLINIQSGTIEVDGNDEFVREVYNDFKEYWKNIYTETNLRKPSQDNLDSAASNDKEPKKKVNKVRKQTSSSTRGEAQILKDLDMNGGNGQQSLEAFFQDHSTKSDTEKNVVFTHYLSEIKGINPVTQDHLLTCYHTLEHNLPKSMVSSIKNSNATSRGGYLMSSNPSDVQLSVSGRNLILKLKKQAKAESA